MSSAVSAVAAATVLIIRDDPFQVLMVRRRQSSFYASALVFPGGAVDERDASDAWLPHIDGSGGLSDDERALRVAACREVYEEAGLLLGGGQAGRDSGDFLAVVQSAGVRLPLSAMTRFGHWTTPERVKRRFDTHFYLCAAPAGAVARADGVEVTSAVWVSPAELLARAEEEAPSLLPPTLMNLKRLAEAKSVAEAFKVAESRPIVRVQPRVEKRESGIFILIPEEAGYGVTELPAPRIARE